MIVAVTGAAGHVGGNLVRALLERGDRVRALARSDTRALSGLDVELVRGDLRERKVVAAMLEGVERVFHAAATVSIDPRDDAEVAANNVEISRRVAEACLERGVRLIHFSSIHALASREGPMDESAPLAEDHPTAYDRSKARAENEVFACVAKGLDGVIVNPTAVLGPHDFKPSEAGRMLLQLARRRLPCVVDGGFNWVDARDVASGALAAGDRGRAGERYLLTGTWLSVRDLASLACGIVRVRPPRWCLPIGIAGFGVPFAALLARMTGARPLFTRPALEALRHHREVRGDKAAREAGVPAAAARGNVAGHLRLVRSLGGLVSEPKFYAILLDAWFGLAAVTFLLLQFVVAPYGRHARPGFGPAVSNRSGWIVMEAPAALGVAVCFVLGPRTALSAVFLVLWESHYAYRAFVFPFRLKSSRPMPVTVAIWGAIFNVGNAYLIGRSITLYGRDAAWVHDPRFAIGIVVFFAGMATHLWADGVLRGLRRPAGPAYVVPEIGLYRWISCPNYLGEMIEWFGWAMATWSLAGLAFALFTVANLMPRALAHDRWYRDTFPDYPASRRAIVPWVF